MTYTEHFFPVESNLFLDYLAIILSINYINNIKDNIKQNLKKFD